MTIHFPSLKSSTANRKHSPMRNGTSPGQPVRVSSVSRAWSSTTRTIFGFSIEQRTQKPPQVGSDGIALDAKNGYLYYHALTGHTLYRIKTSYLTDRNLSKNALESKVETVAQTPAPDGMLEAPGGSIYLTDLEDSAIVRWNVATNKIDKIIADKRLLWPDTLSWGPGGELYVTASQIENMPRFNNGKSTRTEPYKLFKVTGL